MTGPPCQHERSVPTENRPAPTDCRKCGRYMPPEHDLPEAPKPAEPRRDLHRERDLTKRAGLDTGAAVDKLIGHSEARAEMGAREYGSDTDYLGRDLGLEAAQELCDLRNYLVWVEHQAHERLATLDLAHLQGHVHAALGLTARCYEVVEEIRELLRDAPNHPAFDPEIGRTTDHGTW